MSWPQKGKRFWIVDSKICIWNDPVIPADMKHPYPMGLLEDLPLFDALRKLMRRCGFTCALDPRIKKQYPSISKGHYRGRRGVLEYKLSQTGLLTEVGFFIEGGEYGFDLLRQFPYLVKIRHQWVLARITRLLGKHGYRDDSRTSSKDYLDTLRENRDRDFSGRWAVDGNREYLGAIHPGNAHSGDGDLLAERQTRCCYDYSGHLAIGTIYYHLNNMWYLVSNGRLVCNLSSGDYFSWRPELPRRGPTRRALGSIAREMDKAVKVENFGRAAVLKVARDRMAA